MSKYLNMLFSIDEESFKDRSRIIKCVKFTNDYTFRVKNYY